MTGFVIGNGSGKDACGKPLYECDEVCVLMDPVQFHNLVQVGICERHNVYKESEYDAIHQHHSESSACEGFFCWNQGE